VIASSLPFNVRFVRFSHRLIPGGGRGAETARADVARGDVTSHRPPNGSSAHLHASPPRLTRRGATVAAPKDEIGRSELQRA
jgi:hypothetical protein